MRAKRISPAKQPARPAAHDPFTGAAVAALLAAPTVIAFDSGGYFDGPRLVLGIGAWILVLVAVIVAERPLPRSRPGWAALGGMTLLTAVTGASIAWAPLSSAAVDDTQRLIAYLGAFVAGIALLRRPQHARLVEPALAAGAFVVIAYSLSERLLPGLVELDRGISAAGRLEQPLTYWNAMGAVAAIGLVLCARLAGDGERGPRLRTTAGFIAPTIALGLFLSLSRGAIAAAAVGLAVLVLVAPSALQLRSVALTAGLGVLVSLVSLPLPAVRSLDPAAASPQLSGLVMLAGLLAAGAVGAYFARRPSEDREGHLGGVRLRTARIAAAVTLAACLVGAVAVTVASSEKREIAAGPAAGAGPERLRSVQSNRSSYWDVAVASFADHPLGGVGSGGFRVEWLRERPFKEPAEDAHSIYLETASELGLAGLLPLALLFGGVAMCARRGLIRRHALAAGPVAGLSVWAAHAGLDWDWEMPAVSLLAVVLAAAVVAAGDEVSPRRAG